MSHPIWLAFACAAALFSFFLSACAPSAPIVIRETVVVTQVAPAVPTQTLAAPPTTIAQAPTARIPDTVAPTEPLIGSGPKTLTPTNTVVPTAAPAPTKAPPPPTPPRLLVAAIPGDKDKIDGQIVYPDYGSGARTELVFQAKARDPRKGNKDGAGIKSVDFSISDQSGQVYSRTENNAAYCAFGGGEPNCDIFHFADNQFKWPGTNKPIQSGEFTLTVKVHPQSGDDWPAATVKFRIQLK